MRLRGCILLAVFAANVATWAGDLTGTVTLLNARGRPTDLGKGQVIVFVDGLQERFSQESIAKAYQTVTGRSMAPPIPSPSPISIRFSTTFSPYPARTVSMRACSAKTKQRATPFFSQAWCAFTAMSTTT